jgi:hypothetical protein
MLTLEMLPADHGDCLWLEYGEASTPRRILIDGGPSGSRALREQLARRVAAAPDGKLHFELLVITHVDDDHIAGVLDLFERPPAGVGFGDIWFNAYKHLVAPDKLGPPQGEKLSRLLDKAELPWNRAFKGLAVVIPEKATLPSRTLADGMTLTLLSPTMKELVALRRVWCEKCIRAGLMPGQVDEEEPEDLLGRRDTWPPDVRAEAAKKPSFDREEANGSSIALLAEFDSKTLLLAGDAFAPVLQNSIERLLRERQAERLRLDAFKLSHHGSRKNLSNNLLQLLRCPRYLISTSGKQFGHPDNEALSRVVVHGGREPRLSFNYVSKFNRGWRIPPRGAPTYAARYPEDGTAGLTISF